MATTAPEELPAFFNGLSPHQALLLTPKKDRQWNVNDSTFSEYCSPVRLIDHPEGVEGVITRQLSGAEGNVGIDIAGGRNGRALQDLMKMGLLERALVTNYQDRRGPRTRLLMRRKLQHVKGSIMEPLTWQQIDEWRQEAAPEGLALVMHRPAGGMQDLPVEFYRRSLHYLLDTLRPGGVMFTQIPSTLRYENAGHLDGICQSIRDRGDIEMVATSRITHDPYDARAKNGAVIVKTTT